MNDFVEQCRLEWKRLGVPEPLAKEMAADLATDLREAEAEGVSAEELLGSSAFDPRSFAAAWAAERGIIPVPNSAAGTRRRPRFLVAFTAVAAIALIVALLLLATGRPKATLVQSRTATRLHVPPPHAATPAPGRQVLQGNLAAPVEWMLLLLAIVALAFAAWLWSNWRRTRSSTVPA
jgi:hypothetical protein